MKLKKYNQYKMSLLDLLTWKNIHILLRFFKEFHWVPVEERIIIKNLLLVTKISSKESQLYLSDFVEFYVLGRTNPRST